MRINYQSAVTRPAKSTGGKILYWISKHPLRTGFSFALITIALLAPLLANVLLGSPPQFLVIVGGICLLWIALLFLFKSTLHSLGSRHLRVKRYIDFQPNDYFEWVQGSEKLGRIENPKITLYAKSVPEELLESGNRDRSWPIWIVVYNGTFSQDRIPNLSSKYLFIVETEVTAAEASNYPKVPNSVVRKTNEQFSTEKALNLLSFADRADT